MLRDISGRETTNFYRDWLCPTNYTSSCRLDVPRQTPHFHDYQWSSAGVVIQFAAVPTMTTQTGPSVSSTVLPPPLLDSSICCQINSMALMLRYAICSILHAAENDCTVTTVSAKLIFVDKIPSMHL